MKHPIPPRLTILIKAALLGLIALHSLHVTYIPLSGGVDPSWQYMINYAFHHHLPFIFTSGPFGFINCPMSVGANLDIAILFRLATWIGFSGLMSYLVVTEMFPLVNLALFAGFFALGSSISFDYVLCFLILFLLALSLRAPSRFFARCYPLVIALCAFLYLMKFTAAVLAVASCVVFLGFVFVHDKRQALYAGFGAGIGIPVIFMSLFWLYRPSFSEMRTYLLSSYEISAGYNVAMSIADDSGALALALLIILAYLGGVFLLYTHRNPAFPLAFMTLPAVFVVFKHGFVRQDGHEMAFWSFMAILTGLVLLFADLPGRRVVWMLLLVPVTIPLLFWPRYAVGFSRISGLSKIVALVDVIEYRQTPDRLTSLHPELLTLYSLPQDWREAIGERRVSIFPWEVSYAPVNDLRYQPFPVIQAYSAYTPYLDGVNAEYLEDSDTAPECLLMQWLALDKRHMLMDVPATWLSLYRWYDVTKKVSEPTPLMLLTRRAQPRFQQLEFLARQQSHQNEYIALPAVSQPVVMKVSLKLSLLGKLTKLFFRIPEVNLELVTDAGYGTFRVVPDTIRDGLLINYLPIHLDDLVPLMNAHQTRGQVYGFRFSGKGLACYQDTIDVEFATIPDLVIEKTPLPDLTSLRLASAPLLSKIDHASIRESQPTAGAEVPSLLLIRGWAVDSVAQQPAGGVYVAIDDTLYPTYYGFLREDIATRLATPAYRFSGFLIGIPISQLGKGTHTLSVITLSADRRRYAPSKERLQFTIE